MREENRINLKHQRVEILVAVPTGLEPVTFGLGNVVEALFGAFRGLIWAGDNASGWGGFVGELFSRVIAGVGVLTVECATLCDRTANALPFEVGG